MKHPLKKEILTIITQVRGKNDGDSTRNCWMHFCQNTIFIPKSSWSNTGTWDARISLVTEYIIETLTLMNLSVRGVASLYYVRKIIFYPNNITLSQREPLPLRSISNYSSSQPRGIYYNKLQQKWCPVLWKMSNPPPPTPNKKNPCVAWGYCCAGAGILPVTQKSVHPKPNDI